MRDRPSSTAAFVAACRALGRGLPSGAQLAIDPYGALFDDNLTSRIARLSPRWSALPLWPLTLYMQVRTRVIDDVLRAFVQNGTTQVVILGAGYDCRAARFADELDRCRVFEVDHPRTQARKREVLDREGVAQHHITYATWDFESRPVSELPTALAALGHDPALPTLTIWEGVTMYLTEPAIESSVAAIRALSGARSQLCFTYFDRARIDRPDGLRRIVAKFVAAGGEPFRFGWVPSQLPDWLRARGFDLLWDRTVKQLGNELLPAPHSRLVRESQSHIVLARVHG